MYRGPMNNARDQREYRQKLAKIGPSHLLSENGDLSFSRFVFFKTVLGREHSGKVSTKIHRQLDYLSKEFEDY